MMSSIDRKRNAAINMQIGEKDDLSAIVEMCVVDRQLYVIKEGGIYCIALADTIDPSRTNPSIPNSQQRILQLGSRSTLVQRTLLQAHQLLKSEFLPPHIDCDKGMVFAIEFLKQLAVIEAQSAHLDELVLRLNEGFERDQGRGTSLSVPAVGNLPGSCKSFIHGADHALRTLWNLVNLFYPSVKLRSWPEKLSVHLEATCGAADTFAAYVRTSSRFLKFVRNARNALEHPEAGEVVVADYALKSDGMVHLPEITVVHNETPQPPIPITMFMRATVESLTTVFQDFLAFMCERHVQPFAGCPVCLVELPEKIRRYKEARYGYASELQGRIVPFG
jgi:hypothetical protein